MGKLADQTELTHDATSRTLTTPRGELHYHVAGDGPPLLLLHGGGPGVSGWHNFRGNLAVFAEHFTTYILDMPGFGKSYSTNGGSPLLAAPPAVLDFLDGMEIVRLALIGNSMGGGVASGLAATHPERVSRLVTIGGVGMPLFSPSPPEGIKLLMQFCYDPTRERLVAWMESMVYDLGLITDELVEMRWDAANRPGVVEDLRGLFDPGALAARGAGGGAVNLLTRLTNIQIPTLLTWGRDDRVTPLDGCVVPLRVIPRCEVHVFYDCGHWVMIERKREWESIVLAFLLRDLEPD
jgi:2-hydroxy-6-oxonona-2,4-dienedioate hydrolase